MNAPETSSAPGAATPEVHHVATSSPAGPGPESAVARLALEPAGFWIRAVAHGIDWLVMAAAAFIAAVVIVAAAMFAQAISGSDASRVIASVDKQGWVAWLGNILAFLTYHVSYQGFAGSTVGKRLVRVQVIGTAGGRVTVLQAVKRSLAFFVDSLFFGMVGAHFMSESDAKQTVGDQWAETRAVYRRSLPADLRTPTAGMLAGFFVAFGGTVVVDVVTLFANYLWQSRGA